MQQNSHPARHASPVAADTDQPTGALSAANRRGSSVLAAMIAFAILAGLPRQAVAADLPHSSQALLLLRALAYDRNLESRAGKNPTLVVLFDPDSSSSVSARDGMLKAFDKVAAKWKVSGVTLRVTGKAYNPGTLRQDFSGAVAVYVCTGLSRSIGTIISATEKEKVLSLTGNDRDVRSGVSIGVTARGGKPKILVNLRSVRHEGVKLASALLRLAEVIE